MSGEQERIDGLEATVAYQEKTIEELSQAVLAQWQQIEALKRDVANLRRQVLEIAANPALSEPPEPPPPHY